jgi:hypothetical protein
MCVCIHIFVTIYKYYIDFEKFVKIYVYVYTLNGSTLELLWRELVMSKESIYIYVCIFIYIHMYISADNNTQISFHTYK